MLLVREASFRQTQELSRVMGGGCISTVSQDINQDAESSAWLPVVALWRHAQAMCSAMRSETNAPLIKYLGTGQAPLKAVWETLCMGKKFEATARHLSASMASAKAMFMALETEDMMSVFTQHFENPKNAMDYFVDDFAGRRFRVARTGYMGLVPQEEKAGDVLMAIYRAPVPFVFRPVQETENYSLVGACYLHGVMKGDVKGQLRFGRRYWFKHDNIRLKAKHSTRVLIVF